MTLLPRASVDQLGHHDFWKWNGRVRLFRWDDALRTKLPWSLADFLVAVLLENTEPRTVVELSALRPLSPRTLQTRCKEEGTTARDCLDFLWCLKAVVARQRAWDPRAVLSDYRTDDRTVEDLLKAGALDRPPRPTVAHFLAHQRFIGSHRLRDEIRAALKHGGVH